MLHYNQILFVKAVVPGKHYPKPDCLEDMESNMDTKWKICSKKFHTLGYLLKYFSFVQTSGLTPQESHVNLEENVKSVGEGGKWNYYRIQHLLIETRGKNIVQGRVVIFLRKKKTSVFVFRL